ncbi:mobile element protein [Limimaricola cinnabarinus LL-001]|uniref:Mobile element protein n=1 Tax=Limimaricola cinnabarinus LL-001 TaxID=1337093 RepID=U2Z8R1_9RHOB|nr:mobile element protein [Limimaricola cinnabarinus LL-001]
MGRVYAQLTLEERRKIERWRHARVSVNEMARVLRRHRSTIFRELRRNHFQDPCMPKVVGYFAMAAQLRTSDRRARQRKLTWHPQLRDQVVERIKEGWKPEQIAGRMQIERAPLRVCQATIYRYIYAKEGLREELWWYLPTHRKARRPRRARKCRAPKFHRDVSILFRPEAVAQRSQFGHREADLMLFRQRFGSANVTSLVERVSRFTVLLKNADKRTGPSWTRSSQRSVRCPSRRADRSLSTAAPSSSHGRTTKRRSAPVAGSATLPRLGRKARSRTPTVAPAAGYPETATSTNSRTTTSARSAIG